MAMKRAVNDIKEETRKELKKICEVICETVPTVQIYLFGSFAYGEPNEDSDFDLFVVLPYIFLCITDFLRSAFLHAKKPVLILLTI